MLDISGYSASTNRDVLNDIYSDDNLIQLNFDRIESLVRNPNSRNHRDWFGY